MTFTTLVTKFVSITFQDNEGVKQIRPELKPREQKDYAGNINRPTFSSGARLAVALADETGSGSNIGTGKIN